MVVRIAHAVALMALGLSLVTLSCSSTDCDRTGCNTVGKPASFATVDTGLAGAAATESDLVQNGCARCSLTDGSLRVWESSTPIETAEAAQALVDAQGSYEDIEIHGTYERDEPPGEYLACVGSGAQTSCAGITIGASQVVSVHVRYLNGPPELIVFPSGQSQPDTSRTFEVHAQ